jgi:hypothetical protein
VQTLSIRYESGKPVIIADFPALATAIQPHFGKSFGSAPPAGAPYRSHDGETKRSDPVFYLSCLTAALAASGSGGALFFCIYLYFFNSN